MFLQIYTIVFAQIRIHQTSAPPCSAAPYCACAEPPRGHQCMHRPPHVLTNSLHERELVQFIASEAGLFLGISLGLHPQEIPWSSPTSLEGFRLILG